MDVVRAFKAGYFYGETTEAADAPFHIAPARLSPGTYRNVMGSTALALGLVAAGQKSGLRLFFGRDEERGLQLVDRSGVGAVEAHHVIDAEGVVQLGRPVRAHVQPGVAGRAHLLPARNR